MVLYFGARLRKLRKESELTQQQLADKLDVTKASISAYETNAKYPSIEVLIKIANTFNVSADYLLGISQNVQFDNSMLTDEQSLIVSDIVNEFIHLNSKKDRYPI
ncbi:MAG: helix-turn-helix transcriptional regulator [Firmicutes bacterium]|nr:helix-turn-helix transcriptional regulator [Bacillota bacterium]